MPENVFLIFEPIVFAFLLGFIVYLVIQKVKTGK